MAWIQRMIPIAAAAGALGGVVGVPAASGHGEVIRLGAPSVSAGDSLAVTGEGFGERAEITLVLEGAAGRSVLATIRADGEGRFETAVSIPVVAAAGAYRIVAEAGEDRATAELLVTPSVVGTRMEGHPAAVHEAAAATSEKMSLDRRRSAAESTLVWGLVGALVLLGVFLARGARFTP